MILNTVLIVACARKEEPKKDDFLGTKTEEKKKDETRVKVIDKGDKEFINDLMMIIASFSGRLYGSRSAKRRKEQKLKENQIIN